MYVPICTEVLSAKDRLSASEKSFVMDGNDVEGQRQPSTGDPRRPQLQYLDLDYLELRQSACADREPTPDTELSPDSLDLVKVVFLGAAEVGKTSIIQQFVWHEFSADYIPTDQKNSYYPSVIINEHLYEMKISDFPVIPYFPVNRYLEWGPEDRFYGIRSARTVFVLVFDLANSDTFHYIQRLHDQIAESRDMRGVPVIVVGNKMDLLVADNDVGGATCEEAARSDAETGNCSTSVAPPSRQQFRPDIGLLVERQWNCDYVECSAKYNWCVVDVFKRLMSTIDMQQLAINYKQAVCSSTSSLDDSNDREITCDIL